MWSLVEGREGRVRAAAVVVPIGLVVLLAAVLAWRAWDAGRAHRELARSTVRDYADFAAAIVASEAEGEISQALFYAFRPVELAEREEAPAPVPAPALADNEQEARRCSTEDGPVPRSRKWYARLELAGDELEVSGPLAPARRAAVARALRRVVAEVGAGEGAAHGHLFLPGGDRGGPVAYRIRRSAAGEPVAVHATLSCFRSWGGSVFRSALEGSAVLPPGLVGDGPADSLLSVVVRGPGREPIYRSPAAYASEFTGGHRTQAPGPLGGVDVTVTLRDGVGRALVAGGVPPSQLPVALGLLLLAALLAGGTVLQLRRAMELVRARERFVADVSHELRTPLQQILLYVQLLRMDRAGDEDERREALRVTERETLRLIRLVDRVLSFSRPGGSGDDGDEGSRGADPGAVEVARVLEEGVRGFRSVAAARGTEVELTVAAPGLRVRAEADGIRRILVSLLENAVRYGPAGQTVRVGLRRVDGRARITVEDEGPGIPEGERERVWEPFRRLEEGDVAGTGIGLAIVRELVEEAEGDAWIEDGEGGGARVVVELPPAAPDEAEGPAQPAASTAPGPEDAP